MATDVSYPHIEKPGDGPARLRKTPRVRVAQIAMDYLNYGWSVDEMCRQHPYLSAAEAHAAMGYYFDHQAEIEAEIRAELREGEAARAAESRQEVLPPRAGGAPNDEQFWAILKRGATSVERARALTELMRRGNGRLSEYVAKELGRDDLRPTWRNTLILACEHLEFVDSGCRERVRELVSVVNAEWHPRCRLAQEAALRRYVSMIDDSAEFVQVVRFLSTDYPIRVRLIGLLGVQNAFAAAPLPQSMQSDLGPLRDELSNMVEFFFRPATLERSEEDFDLGLAALEALIRLGDPRASEFLRRAGEIGRPWVVRQLRQFLADTRAAWAKLDSSTSLGPVAALDEAINLVQSHV